MKENSVLILNRAEYYDEDTKRLISLNSCEIGFDEKSKKFSYLWITRTNRIWGEFPVHLKSGDILDIEGIISGRIIVLGNLALFQAEYNRLLDFIKSYISSDLEKSMAKSEEILNQAQKLIKENDNELLMERFLDKHAKIFFSYPEHFKKMECAFWEKYCSAAGNDYGILFLLNFNTVTRATLREQIRKQVAANAWQTTIQIKDGEIYYQYIDTLFDPFVSLLIEKNNLDKRAAPIIVYMALQMVWQKSAGEQWEKEYGDNFADIENKSIDDCVLEYLRIDSIDTNSFEPFSQFVNYLLLKGKLDRTKKYIENIDEMVRVYQKNQKIVQEELRKRKLEKDLLEIDNGSYIRINDIDMMTGEEFEHFLARYFSSIGFTTEITKGSGDQGIDVILKKNEIRIGIQAKCYSGSVGNSAIQEAVAGKSYYCLDKVMVITNSYFTPAAIELAQANDVILWDRTILQEKLI